MDLRGHGKSTGRRIYFGLQETSDLSQLLDELTAQGNLVAQGQLAGPVAAVGESYGAALALRWKTMEPRVGAVVAIAPYANLSNAVLNIGHDYAGWMPDWVLRAGIRHLPSVLQTEPANLDTTTVLARHPVPALFIAGGGDKIAPAAEVERLRALASPGSDIVVLPDVSHEALAYYFDQLGPAVSAWLTERKAIGSGGP